MELGIDLPNGATDAPATTSAAPPSNPAALAQRLPSNVEETDWEDESVKKFDFDIYEPRKGQTDRIGVLTKNILMARTHYQEGMGYFLCQSAFEVKKHPTSGQKVETCTAMAACCEKLNPPKKRFGVLIIQYGTAPNGELVAPFGYILKLWRFSDDKYIQLRNMNKEFPLITHDLKVYGVGDEFKKITLTICNAAVWQAEKFQTAYGAQVTEWVESMMKPQGQLPSKLANAIGRKYSEQELMAKLGVAGQAPTTAPGGDQSMIDVNDLLKV